ncbi:MAG: amidohydrolase family protein [Verrucomicrobiales bacterium]
MHETDDTRSAFRRASILIAPLSLLLIVVAALAKEAPPNPSAEASVRARAFTGATLLPVSGPPVEDGVLVVEAGRIVAIGPRVAVTLPAGAEVIDCTGRTIVPGLVCTHSHIGSPAGGDASSAIHPDARVLDAIDIRDTSLAKARAGGVTTVNIMPGSGHLISGQTAYLKLRHGRRIEDLAIKTPDGAIAGGLKMANGTNSIKDPPFPGTRGKSAALVRQEFLKARDYQRKIAAANGDPSKLPDRHLGLEPLVEVLDGRRVVHHHTHRADDILTVLRLRQEFGFKVVLHHVSEAWKVADEIAAAGVGCSIINLDSPGGKLEARDIDWRNGAELERRGVVTAVHTDDPINDSRWMLRSAALSVRGGLSREKALESVTLAGAKLLDLDARLGSLQAGKDADFVLLSGDPLSIYTRVLETWIEGEKVFDLTRPEDRLMAEGGPGAGTARLTSTCCFSR